jgi:hypothetical protein
MSAFERTSGSIHRQHGNSLFDFFRSPAVLVDDLLAQTHHPGQHSADVSPHVRHTSGQEALSSVGQEVGLLDLSFGRVLMIGK